MIEHNITFVSTKFVGTPVNVVCSCGIEPLPAKNGTDAMNIARVHKAGAQAKEDELLETE